MKCDENPEGGYGYRKNNRTEELCIYSQKVGNVSRQGAL